MDASRHYDYWEGAQRHIGFAQAVKLGQQLYISGVAAITADLQPVARGDMARQLSFIFERIQATLAEYGCHLGHVVREVMYATDLDALLAAAPVRKAFYPADQVPASTAVQVSRLVHPDCLIEIEVTAFVPDVKDRHDNG